ncbi:MAG: chlorite dismutase family protein [Methanobacteriota archaeon]
MPARGRRENLNVTTFLGGDLGPWRVVEVRKVKGPSLKRVLRLDVVDRKLQSPPRSATWLLRGVVSNERYTERRERELLEARQPPLGRREATRAALIPITKSGEWWSLAQDERRRIFEVRSGHIKTGLQYLPAIARRLYHGRDLGEPFDFLTWFEYAPKDAPAFESLVRTLRSTEEWQYVVREVDIRLERTTR